MRPTHRALINHPSSTCELDYFAHTLLLLCPLCSVSLQAAPYLAKTIISRIRLAAAIFLALPILAQIKTSRICLDHLARILRRPSHKHRVVEVFSNRVPSQRRMVDCLGVRNHSKLGVCLGVRNHSKQEGCLGLHSRSRGSNSSKAEEYSIYPLRQTSSLSNNSKEAAYLVVSGSQRRSPSSSSSKAVSSASHKASHGYYSSPNLHPVSPRDPAQTSKLTLSYFCVGQKSVLEQIELAFTKWNPASPNTLFQTYLYNAVPIENAPFYGPTAEDDEAKWEEALAKKPSPGAIPVLVRGFEQVAQRMQLQFETLSILQGRLHEINNGLNALLQKHDLEISIRAAECRRRHLRLSRQCLGLAAKTQVLRNRGYAMDSAEEQLRKKLLTLEATVFDPALNGRGEEIWARMVSVRERGRLLQRDFERAGRTVGESGNGAVIDEEVLRRANKVCWLQGIWNGREANAL